MKYAYPAIFAEEKAQGGYSVFFRDFDADGCMYSCSTQGNDTQEAIENAQDALCLTLYSMEQNGATPPPASDMRKIKVSENEFVTLISCDTENYRKFYDSRAVKKTLSIPAWLNTKAERQNVNFSQVLQEALQAKLGL